MTAPTLDHTSQAAVVLDSLLARHSTLALCAPAPEGDELQRILATGLTAPDHGRLRPWHYILIRGAARMAFASLVTGAMQARDPATPAGQLERQRARIHATPLIIALVARLRPHPKVPELEQLLTVGAGAMNILNALQASGYGGIWLSGATAYDPAVAAALGIAAPDRLLGFLYAGTPAEPPAPQPARPPLANHVAEWNGV